MCTDCPSDEENEMDAITGWYNLDLKQRNFEINNMRYLSSQFTITNIYYETDVVHHKSRSTKQEISLPADSHRKWLFIAFPAKYLDINIIKLLPESNYSCGYDKPPFESYCCEINKKIAIDIIAGVQKFIIGHKGDKLCFNLDFPELKEMVANFCKQFLQEINI